MDKIPSEGLAHVKRSVVATTLLLSVAIAVAVGPATRDAVASCTAPVKATAYDDPTDGNNYVATMPATTWYAMSFKVPAATTLATVELYISGDPGLTQPLVVEIRSDSSGKPGAVLATRSATHRAYAYAFVSVDFSAANLALQPGTTYYIAIHSAERYDWATDDTSPTYSEGDMFVSSNSGTSWDPTVPNDAIFRVFGHTCTADTPQQNTNAQQQPLASVSSLGLSHTTFAAESSGPSATNARKKAPRGTKVSFRLNEAASVRFTVTHRLKGRKVKRGKRTVCVKPTKKNRKHRRCKRVVTLKGRFTRNGVAGKNSFHFTGRLRGRKLRPGRYKLVATPIVNGIKGRATSRAFRIVR